VYFIKGRSLPRRELVCEWVAARLAETLGLPIAPFGIADVPFELCEPAMGPWLQDLGGGPAFASERIEASQLTPIDVHSVRPDERALIAAFDWWIQNMDRTLTELGGNPNLLWRPAKDDGEIVLIDHNQAFDSKFESATFLETHAFGEDLSRLVGNFVAREEVRQRLEACLPALDDAFDQVPVEWYFTDPEQTIPATWSADGFRKVLERCLTDELWKP